MNFISVDIETTGLDPDHHQILEIGAVEVVDNKITREFQAYIKWHTIVGTAFALDMNKNIIWDSYTKGDRIENVMHKFCKWIEEGFGGHKSVTFAGKNFGVFDYQFLKNYLKDNELLHRHRFLDPSLAYLDPEDDTLPDLQECCDRAGIKTEVNHRAVDDARLVAELLIKYFEKLKLVNKISLHW